VKKVGRNRETRDRRNNRPHMRANKIMSNLI